MKITEIKRTRGNEQGVEAKEVEPRNKELEDDDSEPVYCQWSLYPGGVYTPTPKMHFKKSLKPGYYYPYSDRTGIHLQNVDVVLDGLVDFGKGISEKIVNEIDLFWKAEKKFRKINEAIKILYKRGILLYGPPGCGKSSLIAILMRDIIGRNGVAIEFTNYSETAAAISVIRQIQPDTKILVVMEDLDTIIRRGETDILKMLDGVDTTFDSILFLATSNYIEKIPSRILRPSRFDLKIKLDFPDVDLRRRYLEDLLKAAGGSRKFNLARAVADSDGFSFADLKELFISACIFEYDYEACLASLQESLGIMRDNQSSIDSGEKLRAAVHMLAVKMTE
jgi:energy-coupling factor transporter ATP-binding protein EcfA2